MIIPIRCFSCGKVSIVNTSLPAKFLTPESQVIADLYEKYIELIGTTINEEGDTMSDGFVNPVH